MDKIRTANLRKNSIREYDIDILKGLGIILVVIGHLEPDKILLRHIYSFHMFLFFFVSGYLCKIVRENYLNYIIKRTKRLLLPFAFWNITAIGIEEILFGTLNWVSCIEQLFFLRGGVSWNAPIWFLLVLFWDELLQQFMIRMNSYVFWGFLGIILACWILISKYQIILPLGFHIVPVALLYSSLGIFVKKNSVKRFIVKMNYQTLIFLIIINICFGVIFNSTISVYHVIYTKFLFTFLAGIA